MRDKDIEKLIGLGFLAGVGYYVLSRSRRAGAAPSPAKPAIKPSVRLDCGDKKCVHVGDVCKLLSTPRVEELDVDLQYSCKDGSVVDRVHIVNGEGLTAIPRIGNCLSLSVDTVSGNVEPYHTTLNICKPRCNGGKLSVSCDTSDYEKYSCRAVFTSDCDYDASVLYVNHLGKTIIQYPFGSTKKNTKYTHDFTLLADQLPANAVVVSALFGKPFMSNKVEIKPKQKPQPKPKPKPQNWYELRIDKLEIQAVPVNVGYGIVVYDLYLYMEAYFKNNAVPSGASLYVNDYWVGGLANGEQNKVCIRLTDYLGYANSPDNEYNVVIKTYDKDWRLVEIYNTQVKSKEVSSHCRA